MESFKDRMRAEYTQLTERIEKIEKAIMHFDFLKEEERDLLVEQRTAMLAYKEVLFKRLCFYRVNMFEDENGESHGN